MLKSMMELRAWLRYHNLDTSEVTVTIEFGGPDQAARASRHLLHEIGLNGSALGLTYPKAVERICDLGFKITGRA